MISVIVPVYKVEKYLDKCVQSILTQTYRDFELILVDDGSPDECPSKCDYYAKKYKNVIVIHKVNGGLSDARNVGTKVARGKYITYIDSDDYVSKDYLQTLVSLKEKYDADIVVTGLAVVTEGVTPCVVTKENVYSYTGMQALEKMMYQNTLDTSACAMLLPADIAKKYQFPKGKYHEDEFTTYKYFSSVGRVIVTTKKQYFYLQREGSIMHVFGQASMDELDAADNLVKFCEKEYPTLVPAAQSKKFSDYCQVLLANTNLQQEKPNVYKKIIAYLDEIKIRILKDRNCRPKNRIAASLLLFGPTPLKVVNRIIR